MMLYCRFRKSSESSNPTRSAGQSAFVVLVTLAKLARSGGLGAVAAESLVVKQQLLIMKRAQRRAPNLTSWDRCF
jgi:hypothetical protein